MIKIIAITYQESREEFFAKKLKQAERVLDNAVKHEPDPYICAEKGEIVAYYRDALAALRAEQERAENKALTLDELKQMDGKPAYIQYGDGNCGWAITTYDKYSDSFYLCSPDFPDENPDTDFYNMEYNDPCGHYGLHVLGWRAYRSKPQEAT